MKKSGFLQYMPLFTRVGMMLAFILLFQMSSLAQSRKRIYNPCFLKDSVDEHLLLIQQYAWKIFNDTANCKDVLLDSIAQHYIISKDVKYLNALSIIRQNPNAKVEDYYTDILNRIIENDFAGFVQQLYLAHGRLAPLESEMIAALNMIVNGHPLKQKYMGMLDAEIEKANTAKDHYRLIFLQRLKQKIQEEKLR